MIFKHLLHIFFNSHQNTLNKKKKGALTKLSFAK